MLAVPGRHSNPMCQPRSAVLPLHHLPLHPRMLRAAMPHQMPCFYSSLCKPSKCSSTPSASATKRCGINSGKSIISIIKFMWYVRNSENLENEPIIDSPDNHFKTWFYLNFHSSRSALTTLVRIIAIVCALNLCPRLRCQLLEVFHQIICAWAPAIIELNQSSYTRSEPVIRVPSVTIIGVVIEIISTAMPIPISSKPI